MDDVQIRSVKNKTIVSHTRAASRKLQLSMKIRAISVTRIISTGNRLRGSRKWEPLGLDGARFRWMVAVGGPVGSLCAPSQPSQPTSGGPACLSDWAKSQLLREPQRAKPASKLGPFVFFSRLPSSLYHRPLRLSVKEHRETERERAGKGGYEGFYSTPSSLSPGLSSSGPRLSPSPFFHLCVTLALSTNHSMGINPPPSEILSVRPTIMKPSWNIVLKKGSLIRCIGV